MPGEKKSITDYIYCIKEATYAQEITAVELLTGLDGQFKIQTPFSIGFLRREFCQWSLLIGGFDIRGNK
jgi:hypothetical protein